MEVLQALLIEDLDNSVSIVTEGEITMTLTGKRALVTGASRGIGAAIAKAFAAEGADVAIPCEKSTGSAAEVVSAIKARERRGAAIQADSANATAVQSSVDKAVAELGGLDILVNNAGIFEWASSRISRSPISTRS